MPANPLHFLVLLPLHLKTPTRFDAFTLFVASTFIDVEMIIMIALGKPMTHGILHSYLMVFTLYPLVLSLILFLFMNKLNGKMRNAYKILKFNTESINLSFKLIYFNCLLGGVSHIFLDMWTHEYSPYVLFPVTSANPFWLGQISYFITLPVLLCSLYSIHLWWRNGFKS